MDSVERFAGNARSVVIIDDHDIVRFGLQTILLSHTDVQVVGCADSLARGLELISKHAPDIVLTDMSLPDSAGLDTVRAVVAAQQARRTLVISMQSELLYAEQVLAAGADGYLPKEEAHASLVDAMQSVLAGRSWVTSALSAQLLKRHLSRRQSSAQSAEERLTARELQVLEQLRSGRTSKQIAAELALSTRTVELYRAAIKKKLGLRTGAAVIAYAFQRL